PAHLTWEEAACNGLVATTAYRQLVSSHAGSMKQGDIVLVWGAAGGLGSYAVQFVLNGGGYPIAVVSSPERAEFVHELGGEWVIDRQAEGFAFWNGDQVEFSELRRFRKAIRALTGGEDPHIVFEHTGRDTFAVSVYVAARGGTITTCAATTGYEQVYDN